MRAPSLIVVVLLLASSGGAAAASPKGAPRGEASARPWRELTSDHFVLKTDLPSKDARKLVAQLEFSRAGLVQALLRGRDERKTRLEVVAFATQGEYAPYAGQRGAEGFLDHRAGAERIVLGPFQDHVRALNVSHELAHHLSYLRTPLQPAWYREGMAEFFSSVSRAPDPTYVAGLPFTWLLDAANKRRVKTRDLLGWRADASNGADYYAWSWLLVHFLVNRHPEALREFDTRLADFAEPTDAWNAAFPRWSLAAPGGTDALDDDLDAYRSQPDGRLFRFPLASIAPAKVAERILSPAEAIMVGLKLERRWEPGELEAKLERALALDPKNVEALSMKAARDPTHAEQLARRAVEAHPEDPAAWRLRGRWPGVDGPAAAKEKEASLRRALELAPHDPSIALDLASHLLWHEKPWDALVLALQAQQASPWKADVHFVAAHALAATGQCDEAAAAATRTARLIAADDARRLPGAEQLLAERVRVCRTPAAREAEAVYLKAKAAIGERDFTSAATLLQQAIAKDPANASARALLGTVYTEMKQYAEAIKVLRLLSEIAPDDVHVWGLLGAALEASGAKNEAEEAFRRDVQVDPEDWRSRRALARFLMRAGRAAEAVPEFEKAAQRAPPLEPMFYETGEARLRAGDAKNAVADLQSAVEISRDARVMNDAAFLLADAGVRLDLAAAWAESAVKEHSTRLRRTPPDQVSATSLDETDALLFAWDTLGWVRFRQGRLAEAERYLAAAEAGQAAAGLEGWAEAAEHLAQVLERAGRRDDAIRAYARAMSVESPPDRVRARLAALAGEERISTLVADARARRRGIIRIASHESVRTVQILSVLGSSGSVLAVRPSSSDPLPVAATVLRGTAHGVPFPDRAADKLVVAASFRCSEGSCDAELGAPASVREAPSSDHGEPGLQR